MSAAVENGSTSPPRTGLLFLRRADIARSIGPSSKIFVRAVTQALALHARGDIAQPLKPYLRWRPDGHIADRIIAMPAYLGGAEPIAGLKWIGSKHDNPQRLNLERASALIVLNDSETHYPVAVMEGGLISALRTAAVTAVATRHLAKPNFTQVSCIGCGPIGRAHVLTTLEQFTQVKTVHLFDLRRDAAVLLAAELSERHPGVDTVVTTGPEEAVRAGELVMTCTVSSQPWLPFEWLRPGAFLSNVSIMDAEKEVFLKSDKVVADDWDQCNREGKVLHQLASEGRFTRQDLHAELSQVVVGERSGRENDSEIIVLNPMGMAITDIACAKAVYNLSRAAGVGTWLSL